MKSGIEKIDGAETSRRIVNVTATFSEGGQVLKALHDRAVKIAREYSDFHSHIMYELKAIALFERITCRFEERGSTTFVWSDEASIAIEHRQRNDYPFALSGLPYYARGDIKQPEVMQSGRKLGAFVGDVDLFDWKRNNHGRWIEIRGMLWDLERGYASIDDLKNLRRPA